MLGDTAVAVHPDPAARLDKAEAELRERLDKAPAKEKEDIQAQIDDIARRRTEMLPLLVKLSQMAKAGRKVMLPLMNREIPLITDEWAKPELGTGCVKITPAHDPNDYDVWQRHQEIGLINILNPDGTLNENAGTLQGLHDPQSPRPRRRRSRQAGPCRRHRRPRDRAAAFRPQQDADRAVSWPISGS